MISYTILRTLQKYALWTLDIHTISKQNRRYRLQFSNSTLFGTRYWYDIQVFFRYRVRYRMAISGYTNIKGKNFDVIQDIGAISGYTYIKVFPSISKIRSILGTICHTWGGQAHRPRSSPADSDSASWSSTCLDGLYSCVTVLTPFPAGVQQLLFVAAVARPWCGLPAGHGVQS